MSSILELKKELENIDQELANSIQIELELESQLKGAKDNTTILNDRYSRLRQAIDIIDGTADMVVSRPSPVSKPQIPLPVPPVRRGPICSACGDDMIRMSKTTRSGVYVEYLQCTDCSNEVYL